MALSYAVVREGCTFGNVSYSNVYEDALATAKQKTQKENKKFVVFQSVATAGTPLAEVEITPTYFDYSINVKQPGTAPCLPASCDDDDED